MLGNLKIFLRKHGLVHIRSTGSHEIWDRSTVPKLIRPITIREKDKDIPLLFIKTNLETLGITMEQFLYEITDC